MKHGSLFSGIGGFDLGFERAGIETIWQVETGPFCRAVLKTHFPNAKLYGDIRECGARNLDPVDIITAGVPCQDVSVAGKRRGLAGEHTGLFYEFARILRELRPAWFVFENVPGLLSSNRGRDFAEVLRLLMVECGYGVAWRVLDSRFFGVAQRRRRVFVVGCFGKPCPAEILFERDSGERDSQAGGEAATDIACTLTSGAGGTGNPPGRRREDDFNLALAQVLTRHYAKGTDSGATDTLLVTFPIKASSSHSIMGEDAAGNQIIAAPITASRGCHGHSSERGDGRDNLVCSSIHGLGDGGPDDNAAQGNHIVILQDVRGGTRDRTDHGQGIGIREGDICYTLGETERHGVAYKLGTNLNETNPRAEQIMSVRRLTPSECEQLQGFPLAWTIPDSNFLPKGLDSARYRALGNAVTVQVAEWIGRRIVAFAGRK